MKKLWSFFSHLKNVIAYNQLPKSHRRLTIYSEGKNYWSYLRGLLQTILDTSDIPVCFVTSSPTDPGLKIEHPRLQTFVIGEGFVRDWIFANMDTDVVVMTMPDLGQYQVKRSSHPVHYVYIQHSLVSLHMVYRPGAFDNYDTIFCAGPHHEAEIRTMEKLAGQSPKNVFEHGYARIDSIKAQAAKRSHKTETQTPKQRHFLLAPSWGDAGTIETGVGARVVELLLSKGEKVTLRPHPQTIKFAAGRVDEIVNKHKTNPNFEYENNVEGQNSLHASDVMICDWSGAALDYAFGLGKPVIFIDVERKVNNPSYKDIPLTPFEVDIRSSIGSVISPDNLDAILELELKPLPQTLADKYVYNVGRSDEVGAREILRLVEG